MEKLSIKDFWKFLGLTQDKIGRKRYLVADISAAVLIILVAIFAWFLGYIFGDAGLVFGGILFIAWAVFVLVVHIKTSIRRVRDIGIA